MSSPHIVSTQPSKITLIELFTVNKIYVHLSLRCRSWSMMIIFLIIWYWSLTSRFKKEDISILSMSIWNKSIHCTAASIFHSCSHFFLDALLILYRSVLINLRLAPSKVEGNNPLFIILLATTEGEYCILEITYSLSCGDKCGFDDLWIVVWSIVDVYMLI